MNFRAKIKKLTRYNGCINDLHNVRLWWDALQPSGRQRSQNIERLVGITEEIVGGEGRAWLATSAAAKQLAKQLGHSDHDPSDKIKRGKSDA